MFALQSSPPPLGPPVVAFLVLVAAASLVGAVGSAVAKRLSNPVGKYRLLYAVAFVAVAALAYVLLALLGLGAAVAGTLGLGPAGLPGVVLADFVEVLAGGLVWLAAYAPTVRGVREVRDVELSTPRAVARTARYVVGLSLLVPVVLVPVRFASSGSGLVSSRSGLLVAGVALVGFGAVLFFAAPWLVPLVRETRAPAGATADHLRRLGADVGLDVRDVRVLESGDGETATAVVRGPPGYRRLFVSTTFLDRFDDGAAAALLAVRAGRLRSRLRLVRVGTVLASGLVVLVAVAGLGSWGPLLALSAGTLVGGFWLSRRRMRAADDYAAGRVGAAAVVDAFEQFADVHALEPTRRRLPNPLSPNVALGDRIDRLRG